MAAAHGSVAHLLPQTYKRMISDWLEEDCPSFDYGGFVVGEKMGEAKLWGKSPVGAVLLADVLAITYICVRDQYLRFIVSLLGLLDFCLFESCGQGA